MPKLPTERRKARLLQVLAHRQDDLTLVLAKGIFEYFLNLLCRLFCTI